MDQAALSVNEQSKLGPSLAVVPDVATPLTYVASTNRRMEAFFLDEVLRMLAFVPWWIASGAPALTAAGLAHSWGWLSVCWSFHFVGRVVFLRTLGGTPGKLLRGLRLVGRDHEKLEWKQCFLRTLTDDLSTVLGLGTRVLAFLRFDRTHLSDWIAETRVVQLVPRSRFPHRRWALTLVLYVILSANGLQASVLWLDRVALLSDSQ